MTEISIFKHDFASMSKHKTDELQRVASKSYYSHCKRSYIFEVDEKYKDILKGPL